MEEIKLQRCHVTWLVVYKAKIPAQDCQPQAWKFNYSLHSYHQFFLFILNGKDEDNTGIWNSNKINQEFAHVFDIIDYWWHLLSVNSYVDVG